jgi:hypothetical protein
VFGKLKKLFNKDAPKLKLVPVKEASSHRADIPIDEDAQEVVYRVIDKVLEFILQEALELVLERDSPKIITIDDIYKVLNSGSIDLSIKKE